MILRTLTSRAKSGECGELFPLSCGELVDTAMGESDRFAETTPSVYVELQSLVAISHDLHCFEVAGNFKRRQFM